MTDKSKKVNRREQRRQARARQEQSKKLIRYAVGLIVLAGLAYAGFVLLRPALGVAVETSGEANHIPSGNPLPQYSTHPPTSGAHYANTLPAGFYDQNSQVVISQPSAIGNLVHNLEHGYVIFWYNCRILEDECEAVKTSLRMLFEDVDMLKVIGFPLPSTDFPVVATSWGRILEMDAYDADLAAEFIQRNRNRAPESNAP
jgi:hypothetical protein